MMTLPKPEGALEWALATLLWIVALAMPAALVVLLWPAITSGLFGPVVFFLALALGLCISACVLWLFAPLAWLAAILVAALAGAIRLVVQRRT